MLKCNESKTDRTIRIILGVILLILGIAINAWWLIVIAAIALITGIIGFCLLYAIFGINTCKTAQ